MRKTLRLSAGFGHSDWPDPKRFDYTFDHIASVIDDFTQAVGLSHYTLYVQDYGGPVGFRMALAHPERVQALIVQNAVAHNEGLGAIWATRRAFWADRPAHEEGLRKNLMSFAATKTRHIGDDPKSECCQLSRRLNHFRPSRFSIKSRLRSFFPLIVVCLISFHQQ